MRNTHIDADGVHRGPTGHRCGESHPRARLTDAQVVEIRRLREAEGTPLKVLAQQFMVSYWCIAKICRLDRRNVELRNYD